MLAFIISLPLLTIISFLFAPAGEVWQHLADTVLKDYVRNSIVLMLGVGAISVFLGVTTAWLTSMCDFNGRKTLEWALLLPLAAPAYIVAFTYAGLLDPAGIIQTSLRELFGWEYGDYWFPEIRSIPGAILILSLVLYPYVYMLARAAFLSQSVCVLEVSRSLGCGPWRTFITIALPLARPAIAAGLTLVSMEALADYGTVQFLGVSTFTTGIFRTWFGLGDTAAAAQLATLLMGFIFALVLLERVSRRGARYYHTSNKYSRLPRYVLKNSRQWLALIYCMLPLTLGFLIPLGQLLLWAVETYDKMLNTQFIFLVWNSLWLAGATALIAVAVAVFLSYAQRQQPTFSVRMLVKLTGMGYAVPGAVIAVGVMIIAGWLDNRITSWSTLMLSGSFTALIFTYLVRFLSISLQNVDAGLSKVKPSMDDAAKALGHPTLQVIKNIHLPIMRGTILTALLLVFVDVLKELPATLVMRPFNFNTLAVRTYELASDERLADASTAGLAIVLTGIIPVILLSRSISRSRPGQTAVPKKYVTA